MSTFMDEEWKTGGEDYQLKLVRGLSVEALRRVARDYDWSLHPAPVLGWIMARQGIDLSTALSVFLQGDPMRFNYLAGRDVPESHRATCTLLDTICLRANSGFYLPLESLGAEEADKMRAWLDYQRVDRLEGRSGRWIFDSMKVRQVCAEPRRPVFSREPAPRAGLLASLFRPRPRFQHAQAGRG